MKNKKNKVCINLIISIMLISTFGLGILLTLIYKNNYQNQVIFSPTITVKDSTNLKELNRYTDYNYKTFIANSIEEVVSKEFNRTTSYLNYTIVLFSVFLTLILVVFGFFTIKKMSEAKDLLDEIMAAPESMMKKYYQNQLKELIPNLISSSPAIKSDTIHKLYSNTELDKDKHYDMLSKIMKQEYEDITSYTSMNVLNLFDILCRLDYSKTIELGYDIFAKHYDHRSMEFLIPMLLESQDKKHKELFLHYILDKSNLHRINKLISYVENFDIYDNEILKSIVKNATPQTIFLILSSIITNRKRGIDLGSLIDEFDESLFSYSHNTEILNLLKRSNQLNNQNIINILTKSIKNSSKDIPQIEKLFNNTLRYVSDDENLKNIISTLKDNLNDDVLFNQVTKNIKEAKKNIRLINVLSDINNEV